MADLAATREKFLENIFWFKMFMKYWKASFIKWVITTVQIVNVENVSPSFPATTSSTVTPTNGILPHFSCPFAVIDCPYHHHNCNWPMQLLDRLRQYAFCKSFLLWGVLTHFNFYTFMTGQTSCKRVLMHLNYKICLLSFFRLRILIFDNDWCSLRVSVGSTRKAWRFDSFPSHPQKHVVEILARWRLLRQVKTV